MSAKHLSFVFHWLVRRNSLQACQINSTVLMIVCHPEANYLITNLVQEETKTNSSCSLSSALWPIQKRCCSFTCFLHRVLSTSRQTVWQRCNIPQRFFLCSSALEDPRLNQTVRFDTVKKRENTDASSRKVNTVHEEIWELVFSWWQLCFLGFCYNNFHVHKPPEQWMVTYSVVHNIRYSIPAVNKKI